MKAEGSPRAKILEQALSMAAVIQFKPRLTKKRQKLLEKYWSYCQVLQGKRP